LSNWTQLQSIVIKIKCCDMSRRRASGATECVQIALPASMASAFKKINEIQDNNISISKIRRIRWDVDYDTKVGLEPLPLVVTIREVAELFPAAINVWFEPLNNITDPRVLETVQAFNMTRLCTVGQKPYDPHHHIMNMVSGIIARGLPFKKQDWTAQINIVKTKAMVDKHGESVKLIEKKTKANDAIHPAILAAIQLLNNAGRVNRLMKEGFETREGCDGCYTQFKNERYIGTFPEEKILTRNLLKEHQLRSYKRHGGCAPCSVTPHNNVEK